MFNFERFSEQARLVQRAYEVMVRHRHAQLMPSTWPWPCSGSPMTPYTGRWMN